MLRCAQLSREWLSLTSAYLGVTTRSLPKEFRTRSGDAVLLESFHDLTTAWIIYCRREYTVLSNDRIIVDAGANIGVFSLYAAREAPRAQLIALEPFPETRQRLEQTIAANHLRDRVKICGTALARADCSRMMALGASDTPSQSRGVLPEDAKDGVAVEAVSLATFLDREGLTQVDMLKMDIEGGEHEVFAGASDDTLRRIARISLEYHPNAPSSVLFARLTGAGFRTRRDRPDAKDSGVAEFERM